MGYSTTTAPAIDFSTMNNVNGLIPKMLNAVYGTTMNALGILQQNQASSQGWTLQQQLFVSLLFSKDPFFTKLVQGLYRQVTNNNVLPAQTLIQSAYQLNALDQGLANAKEVVNIFDDLHIAYLEKTKENTQNVHKFQANLIYTLLVNTVLEKDEKLGLYLWPILLKATKGEVLTQVEQNAIAPYRNKFNMMVQIVGAVQEIVPDFFVVILDDHSLIKIEQLVHFAFDFCQNEENMNKFLTFFKLTFRVFVEENQKYSLEN
ncbi:MAG: hypothetical protein CNLJKLNK_00432 [Holosporales bacterium]